MEIKAPGKGMSAKLLRAYFGKLKYDADALNGIASRKKRTLDQNRFYWGYVIRPLSEYWSYSLQDTHEILKHLFLKEYKTLKTPVGEELLPHIRSTTSLNSVEFEAYMQRIKKWALAVV